MSDPANSPHATNVFNISARFCGPPASANGGYAAGRFAGLVAALDEPVTVTLRRPPPLNTPLHVESRGELWVLLDGSSVIADAKPGQFRHEPVPAVDREAAQAVHSSYPGLDDHSFDGCFVCGPGRRDGDGMKLCPGSLAPGQTACVWTPDPSLAQVGDPLSVASEFVWAALDCPGGWTSDLVARPLVLGRMTASVERLPAVGHRVVVVGSLLAIEGRKTFTATTAFDDQGLRVGRAEQTWIEVDPATFYPDATAAG